MHLQRHAEPSLHNSDSEQGYLLFSIEGHPCPILYTPSASAPHLSHPLVEMGAEAEEVRR